MERHGHARCICSVGRRRCHPDSLKTQPAVALRHRERMRKHLGARVPASLSGSREGARQSTQRGAAPGSGGKAASKAGGPRHARLRTLHTARISSPAPSKRAPQRTY